MFCKRTTTETHVIIAKDLARVIKESNPLSVVADELEFIAENLDRIAEILKPE